MHYNMHNYMFNKFIKIPIVLLGWCYLFANAILGIGLLFTGIHTNNDIDTAIYLVLNSILLTLFVTIYLLFRYIKQKNPIT